MVMGIQVSAGNRALHYGNMPIQIHVYRKFLPPKNENFQIKNSDIFHISIQNIDCGTR